MTDAPADASTLVAHEIEAIVVGDRPRLGAIEETQAGVPIAPGKWSRKQILGHLLDSAFNNHQRFVRAQLAPSLAFPGYAQDAWVAAQAYDRRSWADLVDLWATVNRHLAHVVAHIDPVALDRLCTIGDGAPVTLRFVSEDYVRHLRHHLAQVLKGA